MTTQIKQARIQLREEFPTLDTVVVKSNRKLYHYVVGVRPKGNKMPYVWIWSPASDFPDNALRLRLTLIS